MARCSGAKGRTTAAANRELAGARDPPAPRYAVALAMPRVKNAANFGAPAM